MRLFHTHVYQQSGLNLFCVCGSIKKLECPHKWKVHNKQLVRLMNGNGQELQTLICESCGKITFINTTTGQQE